MLNEEIDKETFDAIFPIRMSYIAFTKVKLPYGWLGNMAPFPIVYDNLIWKTSEALFQALRFSDSNIRESIRKEYSPMSAKMVAKSQVSLMTIEPQSLADLDNMLLVISLKLEQHPQLIKDLIETENKIIIEDCTNRQRGSGLFWGAALVGGEWIGENHLGKIWMQFRNIVQ